MAHKCPSALLKSNNLILYLITLRIPFAFAVASTQAEFRTDATLADG
jgi:hypothetical protein